MSVNLSTDAAANFYIIIIIVGLAIGKHCKEINYPHQSISLTCHNIIVGLTIGKHCKEINYSHQSISLICHNIIVGLAIGKHCKEINYSTSINIINMS